jgi:Flp pilus assembly protein TadG
MFTRIRVGNPKLAKQDGQAIVEFALVLPILLIVILGIVDFGIAYNYKNDETHLANEAVRFAVVNNCSPCAGDSIEEFVKNDADSADLRDGGGQIESPGVTVKFCLPDGGTGAKGDALQATVTAKYNFLPSLLSFVPGLPTQITIESTATQRIEKDYAGAYPSSAYTIVSC